MQPILVIDDDLDCRTIAAAVLGHEGYDVVTAENGAEGLTAARQYHPCLVLLDLMMPVMDGSMFRAVQVSDPEIKDLPVICISGSDRAKDTARRIGAVDSIEKPIDFNRLIEAVQRHCGPPEHH